MKKVTLNINEQSIILNDIIYVSGVGKVMGEYIIEYMTKHMSEPAYLYYTDGTKYLYALGKLNSLLVNKLDS